MYVIENLQNRFECLLFIYLNVMLEFFDERYDSFNGKFPDCVVNELFICSVQHRREDLCVAIVKSLQQ
jgi:hypothetical protein